MSSADHLNIHWECGWCERSYRGNESRFGQPTLRNNSCTKLYSKNMLAAAIRNVYALLKHIYTTICLLYWVKRELRSTPQVWDSWFHYPNIFCDFIKSLWIDILPGSHVRRRQIIALLFFTIPPEAGIILIYVFSHFVTICQTSSTPI